MYKVIVIALLLAVGGFVFPAAANSIQTPRVQHAPFIPEAGVATSSDSAATSTPAPTLAASSTPAPEKKISNAESMRLSIPSIGLNSPITPVGLNTKGEMAVPSGSTNQVGWYKFGTTPGDEGSAVLDAHVFAAFAHLDKLQIGSDLYVVQGDTTLHFIVTSTELYKLSDMDLSVAQSIFNQTGGRYLNLITCAGKLTPDHLTYDHRLVIRTKLVQ